MLLTSGCTRSKELLTVQSEPVKLANQKYQEPYGVIAPDVKFIVVNPDITEEWNKAIKEGKKQPYALISLDEKNYISFSEWLEDVVRYINSQKAVIKAYEDDR